MGGNRYDRHRRAPRPIGASRPWTISLQAHIWTSTTIHAGDIDQALALQLDQARTTYGDGIFINSDASEVA